MYGGVGVGTAMALWRRRRRRRCVVATSLAGDDDDDDGMCVCVCVYVCVCEERVDKLTNCTLAPMRLGACVSSCGQLPTIEACQPSDVQASVHQLMY